MRGPRSSSASTSVEAPPPTSMIVVVPARCRAGRAARAMSSAAADTSSALTAPWRRRPLPNVPSSSCRCSSAGIARRLWHASSHASQASDLHGANLCRTLAMNRWRWLSATIALVLGGVAPGAAQGTDSAAAPARLFAGGEAIAAAGIVVATAAIHPFDERIALSLQRPSLQNDTGLRHTATVFRLFGSPGVLILGGTFYVAGRVRHTRGLAAAGCTAPRPSCSPRWRAGSQVDDGSRAAVRGRRHAAGRLSISSRSPEGIRLFIVSSGHTIAAFASAAALTSEASRSWAHSGWLIGPVLYGSAGMVGLSAHVRQSALGQRRGLRRRTRHHRRDHRRAIHHGHARNRVDRWLLSGTITPAPAVVIDSHLPSCPRHWIPRINGSRRDGLDNRPHEADGARGHQWRGVPPRRASS